MDENAKVNASFYVTKLLPNLIKDCRHLLLSFRKMAHVLTQQLLPKTGSILFDHVLLQLVDILILNTLFKYREGS